MANILEKIIPPQIWHEPTDLEYSRHLINLIGVHKNHEEYWY